MKSYSCSNLSNRVLLREFASLISHDRGTTAMLLAYLAEVDKRKLYLPAGYPSMYLYCVREFRMSEDVAFKRIRAARKARQFPAIFHALADGRLHLSAVVLLAPYLKPGNADDLLAAAVLKTRAEIELLLAQRFPRPDMPTMVQATATPVASDELSVRTVADLQLAPGPVGALALQQVPESVVSSTSELAPEQVLAPASQPTSDPVVAVSPAPRAKLAPLSPGRFAWQVTVDQETQDQLRYAQALLGHAVPYGDVATVLKRALGVLVQQLEQQKFAKCARSRPRRSSANGRYVPAEIRRTVWQRDGGQCTFMSEQGKRCDERTRLEFDHIDPVARGGQTSADRMRLRCRAHNQYDAECTYGAGFMNEKRQRGRCRTGQT